MRFVRPDWPAPTDIVALSTTRGSGESLPPVLAGVRLPQIQQVHGVTAVAAERVQAPVQADAIYTREPGLACRVVTADCLPLLLCTRAGDAIAAVHAGWRGLAAGVIETALDRLAAPPEDLLVWIGPAISQACYEVGGEVLDHFLAAGAGREADVQAQFTPRGDKYLADLPGLARLRLAQRGITAVYGGDRCTFSEPEHFHSWRRDGASAGRIASLICRLPAGHSPT